MCGVTHRVHYLMQLFEFHKKDIPADEDEKAAFAEVLMSYGVSLQQYSSVLAMEPISLYVTVFTI